jgi:hypothetical protein
VIRARWPAALLLFAAVALYSYSVIVELDRRPTYDEAEFVHAAMRIARGERMYVDFAEHHPPFTFFALARLIGPSLAPHAAVVRARIASAICGAFAAALIGLLVWRATGRVEAAAIFVALLMTGPSVWARGFSDVRAEPLALAFWWAGAALVLLAPNAIARGCGIGLVALALVVNPKWPLESIVIGAVFLLRPERRIIAIATAVITSAAAIGSVALMTSFHRYVGDAFQFNVVLLQWARRSATFARNLHGFFQVSPFLRPLAVIPAAAVVGWSARRGERPIAMTFAALAVASLLEVRFVYPYPKLWEQYYVFWSVGGAAVVAIAIPAIARLAKAERALPVAVAATAVIIAALTSLPARAPDPYWIADAALRAKLRGDDTQWVNLPDKPIGTRDASYYWFGFDDFVPAALHAAPGRRDLPPITEGDLPPCRLEKGLEPRLRLMSKPPDALPVTRACFERLQARGVVVPARVRDVFEVK